MSEWLTTGQMIDRLKVGEVAEGNTHWEVKLVEPGHLVELNSGANVVMNRDFLSELWRILPNYVSFEEAMKAHKEKKTVTYHGEELKYTFEYGLDPQQFEQLYYDSISLHELVEGKWTIEDDTK